ncbi:hypothetical protein PROFUN_08912 [Planoprotostelium fungivorum]|uniref:Nucleolar protein 16 n=1 Tax=Planoprotostelium fungivorum TaxID=1890364 RepID=A0A2P6NIW6_9EUKA|nr:hypothetical protein PROFUN_08912 [Planoprotostelium fungivorum]
MGVAQRKRQRRGKVHQNRVRAPSQYKAPSSIPLELKEHWQQGKKFKQNIESLGLSNNTNEDMRRLGSWAPIKKIEQVDSISEEELQLMGKSHFSKPVVKPSKLDALAVQPTAPNEKKLTKEEIIYFQKLVDKYGDDYTTKN